MHSFRIQQAACACCKTSIRHVRPAVSQESSKLERGPSFDAADPPLYLHDSDGWAFPVRTFSIYRDVFLTSSPVGEVASLQDNRDFSMLQGAVCLQKLQE